MILPNTCATNWLDDTLPPVCLHPPSVLRERERNTMKNMTACLWLSLQINYLVITIVRSWHMALSISGCELSLNLLSYTLISTQYCTAKLELSASKKFSQKSQEPRCCKYFSLWINWFSNASDISSTDSLHLDRENKLLRTILHPENCKKKLFMNKSCFTVLYVCYKCLQDSWPISFAHGGDPGIYCQRSLFHFYEEKERKV